MVRQYWKKPQRELSAKSLKWSNKATTTFGTPQDITLQAFPVESLFQADAATETALRAAAPG
jgi:hypothetical protein